MQDGTGSNQGVMQAKHDRFVDFGVNEVPFHTHILGHIRISSLIDLSCLSIASHHAWEKSHRMETIDRTG